MVLRTRSTGTVAGLIALAMIFATGIGLETPPSAAASHTQTRTISTTLAGTGTVAFAVGIHIVEVASSGMVRGAPRAHFSTYSLGWRVHQTALGFVIEGGITLRRPDGSTLDANIMQDGVGYPSLNGSVTITGGTGRFVNATGMLAISFNTGGPNMPQLPGFSGRMDGSISGALTF